MPFAQVQRAQAAMNLVVNLPGALGFTIEAEHDFDLVGGHFYFFAVVRAALRFFQNYSKVR